MVVVAFEEESGLEPPILLPLGVDRASAKVPTTEEP